MNSSNYRFNLDLHSLHSQTSIPAMLGDTGRTWHINLSDGSKPYRIETGCLAKLSIKRPTGTYLEDFCEIRDNTTIVYPFAKGTCAAVGLHTCEVTLYGLDGEVLGSPKFSMVVSDRAVNNSDIDLSNEDYTIVDAMAVAEAARQSSETARVIAELARTAEFEAIKSALGGLVESGGASARIANVTLLANKWVGAASPYSQVVTVPGATENSQVDLTPSVEQLAIFYEKDLAFVTENEGGVVTVYAIGQKPANDYTIQVTITEVNV